ncbi:expressed unknown protein [Ectocarpus siliculosus]|uniref:Uncharacterized protein n=1 Tax=Ectocarpus siliculosus TaxID=2880 RepID=D8LR88_ECTSI|nr:expressed unknown protein [Ectocarpus siliculosus]|eukprot:CBN74993.1 expressed unknown protein [Ectocarpus siliculosus]
MRVGSSRPALLVRLLAVAVLVTIAGGERGDEHEGHHDEHHGPFGLGEHGEHGDHEHHHPEGFEGHDGHHGPFGEHEHHEGEAGHEVHAEECTQTQTQAALKATANYVKCAFLDYADFQALVHADVAILEDAAACFKTKADEIAEEIPPPDDNMSEEEVKALEQETAEKLATAFQECVKEAEAGDEEASQATVQFLEKLLAEESTICACLSPFLIKMPTCGPWIRYHDVGKIVQNVLVAEVDLTPEEKDSQDDAIVAVLPAENTKKLEEQQQEEEEGSTAEAGIGGEEEEEHPAHLPNAFGPCPPGQEAHPSDPKACQPSMNSEEYQGEEFGDGRDGRREGGGMISLGLSVMGVVAVGGVVGVGGVWAWGKFQSGTRQPGVRYMATGLDNNIGTELGPFGRQYA